MRADEGSLMIPYLVGGTRQLPLKCALGDKVFIKKDYFRGPVCDTLFFFVVIPEDQ